MCEFKIGDTVRTTCPIGVADAGKEVDAVVVYVNEKYSWALVDYGIYKFCKFFDEIKGVVKSAV